jgi:hypothetical protein
MLITPAYVRLNSQLHDDRPSYGTSGKKWSNVVAALARELAIIDVLDYGCGKQTLAACLPDLNVIGYDPAIPGLQMSPLPANLVVCTDVLEHVEPECLNNVLEDLCRVAMHAAFVTVATRPARKTLADGRNAHLIVQSLDWWRDKFNERFDIVAVHVVEGSEFALLLRALHADESQLHGFRLDAFITSQSAGGLVSDAMNSRR